MRLFFHRIFFSGILTSYKCKKKILVLIKIISLLFVISEELLHIRSISTMSFIWQKTSYYTLRVFFRLVFISQTAADFFVSLLIFLSTLITMDFIRISIVYLYYTGIFYRQSHFFRDIMTGNDRNCTYQYFSNAIYVQSNYVHIAKQLLKQTRKPHAASPVSLQSYTYLF